MIFNRCDYSDDSNNRDAVSPESYCITIWHIGAVAAIVFVMLVMILVLSILLCRACKQTKKKTLLELVPENLEEEPTLHYAELQNLPVTNRGQCDGGTCPSPPANQTSYYASVAELKGANGEGCCVQEEQEYYGLDDGESVDEPGVEQE